jgi:hypothetical protein
VGRLTGEQAPVRVVDGVAVDEQILRCGVQALPVALHHFSTGLQSVLQELIELIVEALTPKTTQG